MSFLFDLLLDKVNSFTDWGLSPIGILAACVLLYSIGLQREDRAYSTQG